MTYRIKTNRFTRTWLDFKVIADNEAVKYRRIGGYYYSAVFLSAIIAFGVNQL